MINTTAVVRTEKIGKNVVIHEYAVIRREVKICDNVVIHPHVVIENGVTIEDGVEIFPGSYIGKKPHGAGATTRPISFEPSVILGEGCKIGPNAVIYCDVSIGNNTLVGDGASIRERCRVGSRCVVGRYVVLNYCISIGDGVKMMDHTWLAGNMKVGSGVFIGGGVLTSNDHALGMNGYDEERIVGPTIEKGARIGVGAILLPAVKIGRDALVGAGAVVTKDVNSRDVVMGIPARVVKHL